MTCQPMPQAPSVGDFPIVFFEVDVVLAKIDANRAQGFQIKLLHILRRRLQDHLHLRVLEQPIGILAVAAIGRPPRGLHVGHVVGLRPKHAQKGLRGHRARAHFDVVGLLQDTSALRPKACSRRMSS